MFGKVRAQIGEPVNLDRPASASDKPIYDFSESDTLLPCDSVPISVYNGSEYCHWYQVAVANLTDEEYFVVTADNPREDLKHALVPVEAGETLEFEIHFEPNSNRTDSVQIEITVVEYTTDNPQGPRTLYYRKSHLLAPYFKKERFTITPSRRLLQVRPWTRSVGFELVLRNQNELSVSNLELTFIPKDSRGRYIEMEEDDVEQIFVDHILRAHQELRFSVTLPLKQRPQGMVQLEVEASYKVPRHLQSHQSGDYVSKTDSPLKITYVPYMRTWWPDWLLAGLWMLILMAIFFGLPPVYKPELIVHLEFEGLPLGQLPTGVAASDVKTQLYSYGTRPPNTQNNRLQRPARQDGQGKYYVHYVTSPIGGGSDFNNRAVWRLRGWLPWNAPVYEYSLTLGEHDSLINQYDIKRPILKDYETDETIDMIRFSRAYLYGYYPHRVKLYIPYASEALRVELPRWPQPGISKVKLYARDKDDPNRRREVEVECRSDAPTRTVLPVDIGERETARLQIVAEDGVYRTEASVEIERGSPAPQVKLPPPRSPGHFRLSVSSTPPGARVLVGGAIVGNTPLEGIPVPMPTTGRTTTIVVSLEGYEPFSRQVTVQPNQTVNIPSIRLREKAESGNGGGNKSPQKESVQFTVQTNTPNVAIYVDGRRSGATQYTTAEMLYASAPIRASRGASVKVHKPGYRPLRASFPANDGVHKVWMVPVDGKFIQTAARQLGISINTVRNINNSTTLAVNVSYDSNTQQLYILVNKDCWLQVYLASNQHHPQPVLAAEGSVVNPIMGTPPANNFVKPDEPLERRYIDWHSYTHLYVVATTDDVGEQADLLEILRRSPKPSDWCIVGLRKASSTP